MNANDFEILEMSGTLGLFQIQKTYETAGEFIRDAGSRKWKKMFKSLAPKLARVLKTTEEHFSKMPYEKPMLMFVKEMES